MQSQKDLPDQILLQTALIEVTIRVEAKRMSVGISRGPGWFPVAVQALVVLAESDGLCSSSTMAQDLHAHAVFVRRVLTHLVRANLVQAREGRDGGYRLARSAEQMTLAEVYQAVRSAGQSADPASKPRLKRPVQAALD